MIQTEDDLIERGLKAEELMRHEAFHELFDVVVADVTREILETPLVEKQLREDLYLGIHGMRTFLSRLQSYALAKKSIQISRDDEQNIEQDD